MPVVAAQAPERQLWVETVVRLPVAPHQQVVVLAVPVPRPRTPTGMMVAPQVAVAAARAVTTVPERVELAVMAEW